MIAAAAAGRSARSARLALDQQPVQCPFVEDHALRDLGRRNPLELELPALISEFILEPSGAHALHDDDTAHRFACCRHWRLHAADAVAQDEDPLRINVRSLLEQLQPGHIACQLAFEIDVLGGRTLAVADATLLDPKSNEAATGKGGEQASVGLGDIVIGIEGIVDAVSADAADQQHRR